MNSSVLWKFTGTTQSLSDLNLQGDKDYASRIKEMHFRWLFMALDVARKELKRKILINSAAVVIIKNCFSKWVFDYIRTLAA